MVDLTELEDEPHVGGGRRVRVDGALVWGEAADADPQTLRCLLRGLQQLDVDAPAQRHDHAMT